MRIEKLRLTNFRSYSDVTFDLERINIVKGVNGAGKTSIQMAIELLLSGRCAVTDAAGRGSESLIRLGAKELVIEAELVRVDERWPLRFTRNVASGMLTIGNFAAGKNAQSWIQQHIAPIEVLSAVLNSHRFLELSAKEQKALLAGALKSEPVQVDAEIVSMLAKLGYSSGATIDSASQADSVYRDFYEQRTIANRELKAFGEISAPAKPAEMPPLREVRERISEISTSRDILLAKRGALLTDHSAALRDKEAAKAQKQQHEKNIIESNAELEQLQRTAKRKTDAAKADREVAETQADVTRIRQEIAAIESSATACPTCDRAYDEQTLAKRTENLNTLRASVVDAETKLKDAQTKRTKIGDPDQAELKLAAHRQSLLAVAKAEAILKLPDSAPPDTSSIDADVAALDERLAKGRTVEKQVIEYEAAKRQFDQVAEKKESLTTRLAAVEKLVEYFGPNGNLKARLVGDRLPAFRDRVNEALRRFGFGCEFELEPFTLRVGSCDRDGWLELHQLSESEAYRFGIAFQIALAEATGVGLVIIDRADMLTPDARRQLSGELMSSRLDQAIVLTTAEVGVTEYRAIEDTAFFELVNTEGVTGICGRFAPDREAAHAAD